MFFVEITLVVSEYVDVAVVVFNEDDDNCDDDVVIRDFVVFNEDSGHDVRVWSSFPIGANHDVFSRFYRKPPFPGAIICESATTLFSALRLKL